MCLLLKFDRTTFGVSSLLLSKVKEENLFGCRLRSVIKSQAGSVLEFDQTFPKNNFGYQKLFFEIFAHMSCMTGHTEASNFPNLHKFGQKINFWIVLKSSLLFSRLNCSA